MATSLDLLESGFISGHVEAVNNNIDILQWRIVLNWSNGSVNTYPWADVSSFVPGYNIILLRHTKRAPSVVLDIRRRLFQQFAWDQVSFLVKWKPSVVRTPFGYRFWFSLTSRAMVVSYNSGSSSSNESRDILTGGGYQRGKSSTSLRALAELKFRQRNLSSFRSRKRIHVPHQRTMSSNFVLPNPVRHYTDYYRVIATQEGDVVPTPLQYESYFRGWTSVKTPGFWNIRNRKRLPDNPYSLTLIITHDQMGADIRKKHSDSHYVNTTLNLTTGIWNVGASVPAYVGRLYNECVRKLISATGSNVSNLAQDFAQIGQTVDMIADTATRLTGAIKKTKAGNFSGAWDSLTNGTRGAWKGRKNYSRTDDLAGNWLSLQYGWKPLLSDIRGTAESLARLNLGDLSVVASQVSARESRQGDPFPIAGADGQIIGYGRFTTIEACRIGVRWSVDDHFTAFLQQTGFTNPINLAWELLPYSFVVDWFVPIGPWLESLSAFQGLKFHSGYVTKFLRRNDTATVDWSGYFSGSTDSYGYARGSYARKYIMFDRAVLSSWPTMNPPTFKNPFSVTHSLNALALMASAFK